MEVNGETVTCEKLSAWAKSAYETHIEGIAQCIMDPPSQNMVVKPCGNLDGMDVRIQVSEAAYDHALELVAKKSATPTGDK